VLSERDLDRSTAVGGGLEEFALLTRDIRRDLEQFNPIESRHQDEEDTDTDGNLNQQHRHRRYIDSDDLLVDVSRASFLSELRPRRNRL
jgi:hypothetical protein